MRVPTEARAVEQLTPNEDRYSPEAPDKRRLCSRDGGNLALDGSSEVVTCGQIHGLIVSKLLSENLHRNRNAYIFTETDCSSHPTLYL